MSDEKQTAYERLHRTRAVAVADLCTWLRGFAEEMLSDDPSQKAGFLGFVEVIERVGSKAIEEIANKRVLGAFGLDVEVKP